MIITKDVKYIGVNDYKTDLFEGQFKIPKGISYNSYIILDDKIAVLDTVDYAFKDEWLKNIDDELGGKKPDYLIIHHMEPDHSSNIMSFLDVYPNASVVASAKAFEMMKQFYNNDLSINGIVIKEGDKLSLGKHSLEFIEAKMVHWPEVVVSYDCYDKILFSADAFGKFGALDHKDDWTIEARRYYIGIVGKYGRPVEILLNKVSKFDISIICPLHGPVLNENLGYYINLYKSWASYEPEDDGIVIAYSSVYGNTKECVIKLSDEIKKLNYNNVYLYDLARTDMSFVVTEAFRYSKLVLASPTYNADVFPHMREFINHLVSRDFKNRTVALIENGCWSLRANYTMKEMLSKCRCLNILPLEISIYSRINEENKKEIYNLALELVNNN